jgi:hypothetical protein
VPQYNIKILKMASIMEKKTVQFILSPDEFNQLLQNDEICIVHKNNFLIIKIGSVNSWKKGENKDKIKISQNDLDKLNEHKNVTIETTKKYVEFIIKDVAAEFIEKIKNEQIEILNELANFLRKMNSTRGNITKKNYTSEDALQIIQDLYSVLADLVYDLDLSRLNSIKKEQILKLLIDDEKISERTIEIILDTTNI